MKERYVPLKRGEYTHILREIRKGKAAFIRAGKDGLATFAVNFAGFPAHPVVVVINASREKLVTALPKNSYMLCNGSWLKKPKPV